MGWLLERVDNGLRAWIADQALRLLPHEIAVAVGLEFGVEALVVDKYSFGMEFVALVSSEARYSAAVMRNCALRRGAAVR